MTDPVFEDLKRSIKKAADALWEALPVVRCGECRHWDMLADGISGWCAVENNYREFDEFCKYWSEKPRESE